MTIIEPAQEFILENNFWSEQKICTFIVEMVNFVSFCIHKWITFKEKKYPNRGVRRILGWGRWGRREPPALSPFPRARPNNSKFSCLPKRHQTRSYLKARRPVLLVATPVPRHLLGPLAAGSGLLGLFAAGSGPHQLLGSLVTGSGAHQLLGLFAASPVPRPLLGSLGTRGGSLFFLLLPSGSYQLSNSSVLGQTNQGKD